MAILTIVVAIAAPKLAGFATGRKTNYAAVQIVALAKYARTEAINEGQTYRLNFDTSANPPHVTGRISRARGSHVIDAERPVGTPEALTEEQVLEFLLKELEAFVER